MQALAEAHTHDTASGSMKSRIDPRVCGRINPLPAQSGLVRLDALIRSRLDPVLAGSTRWRFDPALERVDPLAA